MGAFCSSNKVQTTHKVSTKEIIIDRESLTPHQAYCLFGEGIERAFTGEHHDFQEIGSYHCGACDSELFK